MGRSASVLERLTGRLHHGRRAGGPPTGREDGDEMSLTDDELHRLDQIESHLRWSDPSLSRHLDPSFDPARHRRSLVGSVSLLLLGTMVMVAGAAGVTALFSYGTVFVLLGLGLMARALQRLRDLNPPPAGSRTH